MVKLAQRLQKLPTYAFATLEKRIAHLTTTGNDIIRMDIGSPDLPPDPKVVATLSRVASQSDVHGYPGYYGLPIFRQTIAKYYARRFDVALDPDTEVLPLLGSKEGIYHVAQAFIDPGTIALVPDPGYPTYRTTVMLAGGKIYAMPLLRENHFLPDFHAIPAKILTQARILWLNYPHNPTTAQADITFFTEAVAFARRHDLLIIHDNAYADVNWIGIPAPSILQTLDAKAVCIELSTMSKSANMAGWRVGMAVGNAEAIAALAQLKTNVDSGIFRPLQEASTVALTLSPEWLARRNSIYKHRRNIVTRALNRMRLWYAPYAATLYVWAEIPPYFENSAAFADALLTRTGVSIAPGTLFGPHGEGYVRISIVQPEDKLEEAMERWERWLISQATGITLEDLNPITGQD